MRVQDYKDVAEVSTDAEIELALSRRYGTGVNAIWLSHGSERYPAILILINGDHASLHFFDKERSPGLRSDGNVEGLTLGETSVFYMNNEIEEHEVLNDSVVSLDSALNVAKEFCKAPTLPKSISWIEL